MAAKTNVNNVFARIESGELISIKGAMALAEITSQGAWGAAVKAHDYLKNAIVEKNEFHNRLVERAAVERYMAERGTRGSRDGLKWFRIRLTDEQAASFRNDGYVVEKPTAKKDVVESEELEEVEEV